MLRSGRSAAEVAAHGVCPVPRVGASCVGVDGLPVRTDAVEVYGQLIHNDIYSCPGNRRRARVHLTKPNANGSSRSPKRKLRSRIMPEDADHQDILERLVVLVADNEVQ